MKRIEEEKDKYKGGKIEEWNREENEEDWWRIKEDRKYLEELENENQDMGDLRDPYNKLWRSPWNENPWKENDIMNYLFL